jgi:hypothetical protein
MFPMTLLYVSCANTITALLYNLYQDYLKLKIMLSGITIDAEAN